jgi:hypothetical protein
MRNILIMSGVVLAEVLAIAAAAEPSSVRIMSAPQTSVLDGETGV